MTVADILIGTGLPYAYDHFAEGESPKPPFAVYYHPESTNFGADNIVWLFRHGYGLSGTLYR